MSTAVIHVNSCGFGDEINELVSYHQPLALVITEHKRQQRQDLDVIKGYSLAAWFPATTKIRGVAVYVRKRLQYNVCCDLDAYAVDGLFEIANVEIISKKVLITGLYRSPSTTQTDFNNLLQYFVGGVKQSSRYYGLKHAIVGDFNIDSRKNSATKNVLRNIGYKFNLRSETHFQGGCLDNFVTNFQPQRTRVMTAKRDQVGSDHYPIEMVL